MLCLSVCPFVCLSVCLSVCVSVCPTRGCLVTQVEDAGIAALSKLTELTSLSLSGCVSLTERGLGHVAAFLSGLKSLRLGGCSRVATITDACLLHLQSLTQLTHLDLAGCLEISDSGDLFQLLF